MHWFFWALLSALLVGLTDILAKMGMKGISPHVAVAVRSLVVIVVVGFVVTFTRKWHQFATLEKRAWLLLILSGATTAVGWICLFQALQKATPPGRSRSTNSAWFLPSFLRRCSSTRN